MRMTDIRVPKRMIEKGADGDEGLQNEVMLYQLLHRQLGELSARADAAERKLVEAEASKKSLTELGGPSELLMPIGSGCYAKGSFLSENHMLVDIGAGILLRKSKKDAISFIEGRAAEMAKVKEEIQGEARKVASEMNRIAMKANK